MTNIPTNLEKHIEPEIESTAAKYTEPQLYCWHTCLSCYLTWRATRASLDISGYCQIQRWSGNEYDLSSRGGSR